MSENTDFEQILYGDADYWMSPDISAMDDYKNSSSKRSYASVIVWPLRVFGEEDTRDDKNIFCALTQKLLMLSLETVSYSLAGGMLTFCQ